MKEERSAVTRRRFLQTTIAGGVAVTSMEEAALVRSPYESDRERLKRIARECGSELGAVRRVGR